MINTVQAALMNFQAGNSAEGQQMLNAQEYNNEEQWASDTNIVQAWLAQPDEVQP